MSSLQEDTTSIKSMMIEMYDAFRGQSSLAPSGSVTPTLALTHIPANVEGENATHNAIEEPPSHTEGETDANKQEKPEEPKQSTNREGKGIATDDQVEDQRKLVKASSIVRPNPDEPKAKEEARLNAISNPEVIKVVREEAKKLGIHPKEAITTKVAEGDHSQKEKCSGKRLDEFSNPFLFGEFGISELDELREITPKKKNAVVKDLMNSLIPEQASSQTSGRKKKHMELEPEVRILGLECNRALP
ncbi:hypothetical protein Tco_0218961, partial [Tanacetum coccineum]